MAAFDKYKVENICKWANESRAIGLNQCLSTVLGRRHPNLGHQNLYYSNILVLNGASNWVLFGIVGHQPLKVDNHFTGLNYN